MDKHMSMMKKMMSSEQSMMIKDAITLFREAARLDPRSPLPPAALVEAIRYDITGDRCWPLIRNSDPLLV
jgi:hypothetical protein